jgi:hypothetical protein
MGRRVENATVRVTKGVRKKTEDADKLKGKVTKDIKIRRKVKGTIAKVTKGVRKGTGGTNKKEAEGGVAEGVEMKKEYYIILLNI